MVLLASPAAAGCKVSASRGVSQRSVFTSAQVMESRAARRQAGVFVIEPVTRLRGLVMLRATEAPAAPTKEKSTQGVGKRPPNYKLLLHNDDHNRREYVVQVLCKVVKDFGVDQAVNVMEEAHDTGVAMVVACPQEEAEGYCESLRGNGLRASIEPGC